jgi:hypothetical protein
VTYFVIPSRRFRQPQGAVKLTRAAREECYAAVLGSDGRNLELVSSSALTPSGGTAKLQIGSMGIGFGINADPDKWESAVFSTRQSVSATDFTLEMLVTMSRADPLSHIFGIKDSGTTLPGSGGPSLQRSLLAYPDTPGNIYFWGSGADRDSGIPWDITNRPQHVFCSVTGGEARFYRGGVQVSIGVAPVLTAFSSARIYIGSKHDAGTGSSTFTLYKGTIRNRALNAAEIAESTKYPWSDFLVERNRWYFLGPPAPGAGNTIAVPAGTLTLAGQTPTVATTAHQYIAVPAGALTVTGFAPTVTVSNHQTVAVPAGTLALTANAPTVAVSNNQAVAVPAGTLALTANAPTVAVSDHKTISVPTGTLTLTGIAPAVVTTAHQYVDVPAGAVTLTGFAPTVQVGGNVTVDVPAAAITLTGFAPTVATTAHNYIAVPAAALTLSGFAPTVQNGANHVIDVPAGALSLTGFAPTVVQTAHQYVAVPAGALTLTAFAPTVVSSDQQTVSVPAGTLSLTGFAPTVVVGTVIDIPAGVITLTGLAPQIVSTGGQYIAVPAATVTLTGYAPTVLADPTQTSEPGRGIGQAIGVHTEPRIGGSVITSGDPRIGGSPIIVSRRR